MGILLSREDILGADDIEWEDVSVPEWGGTVRVRGLNGKERYEYFGRIMDSQGETLDLEKIRQDPTQLDPNFVGGFVREGIQVFVVSCCTIGEDGSRLFSPEDIERLGEKNSEALERVYEVASRLSGFGRAEESGAKKKLRDANGSSSD